MPLKDPYSVQIWRGVVNASAVSAQFVPPTGFVWVMTDLEAWTYPGTGVSLRLEHLDNLAVFELDWQAAGVYWHQWTGRLVIPQGDGFQIRAGAGNLQVTVSGYQLAIVA